jgi:hypothetical protein
MQGLNMVWLAYGIKGVSLGVFPRELGQLRVQGDVDGDSFHVLKIMRWQPMSRLAKGENRADASKHNRQKLWNADAFHPQPRSPEQEETENRERQKKAPLSLFAGGNQMNEDEWTKLR